MTTKSHKVRKGIEVSAQNLEWFYKEFGDDASLSWYVNLLMTQARELHEIDVGTPAKIAKEAASLIKEIEHEI
jgi:hypothetical protein